MTVAKRILTINAKEFGMEVRVEGKQPHTVLVLTLCYCSTCYLLFALHPPPPRHHPCHEYWQLKFRQCILCINTVDRQINKRLGTANKIMNKMISLYVRVSLPYFKQQNLYDEFWRGVAFNFILDLNLHIGHWLYRVEILCVQPKEILIMIFVYRSAFVFFSG
jgi:hypothetical protein